MVGLERGWEVRERAEGTRIAGIRTFGIVGLFGGVVGLLSSNLGGWIFASAAAALGMLVAAAHFRAAKTEQDQSITSVTALLACFTLAVLAGIGEMATAGAAAVIIAALLGIKPELHGLLRQIRRQELLATIRLLLISVVILPILPDQGFGPFESLNPYRLWWMVVLVATLSYVGYIAVRLTGVRRGILVTALFGGLSSSTAITLNLARLAREKAVSLNILAGGTVTASAVMFPRTLVVAGIVAPDLLAPLATVLLPAGIVSLIAAWWWFKHDQPHDRPIPSAEKFAERNPLDLTMAIKFGALLVIIMLAARAASEILGGEAVIGVAAISGLADVDAITLSMADAATANVLSPALASSAICAAVLVNTIVKITLTAAIAGTRAGLFVGIPLISALGAGGIGLWFFVAG